MTPLRIGFEARREQLRTSQDQDIKELEERLRGVSPACVRQPTSGSVMSTAEEALKKIEIHEAECKVLRQMIDSRLESIEKRLDSGADALFPY